MNSVIFNKENQFYHSCNSQRISKLIAHYELYKRILSLQGQIVECGVFKGTSLIRWAHFTDLLEHSSARRIIGFDTFSSFPETSYDPDQLKLNQWTSSAGNTSLSKEALTEILSKKGLQESVELVEGDINDTVPAYCNMHPELRIALLNINTDVYEPAVTIFEHLYQKVVHGGIVLVDNYGVFPGETKAFDDYFRENNISLKKLTFAKTPSYFIKGDS